MTSRICRPLRWPILGGRLASAMLALLAAGTVPVIAACGHSVSATEVRVNGAPVAATASARRTPGLVPPPSAAPPKQTVLVAGPKISARSAIVIDDASGAVLYEYNGRVPIAPASLTKIATAAVAVERGKVDDWVTVDVSHSDPALLGASVMGIERGDRFKLRDLIYGMMLPSGGDAAIAIGRAVSGSDQAFVKELNALMASLGLYDTRFIDPHGLGGPSHVSTAYDMAMLSRYAMRQPLFAEVARTQAWRAVGSRTIEVYNTNPFAFGYRGGDGVKSGYTEEAGATLSASATREGHRVIVVVLDASLRTGDTVALMDWAFETFCWNDGALGCNARPSAATR